MEVIDKTKEMWVPDGIVASTIKYFQELAFPLLYVDGVLIGIASPQGSVQELMEKRTYEATTEKDILEAAEKYGFTDR